MSSILARSEPVPRRSKRLTKGIPRRYDSEEGYRFTSKEPQNAIVVGSSRRSTSSRGSSSSGRKLRLAEIEAETRRIRLEKEHREQRLAEELRRLVQLELEATKMEIARSEDGNISEEDNTSAIVDTPATLPLREGEVEDPAVERIEQWKREVPRAGTTWSWEKQHFLRPLELPKFNGDQRDYTKWKQRFLRLVDDDSFTSDDHKLARLREALSGGSAEELVEGVLDGPGAYQAVLAELEEWFGGSNRELEHQRREVLALPRVTNEKDTASLQKLAVKLRNLVLNLRTCGMIGSKDLYLSVTQKLPRTMLAKYMESHDDATSDAEALSQWLLRRVHRARQLDERLAGATEQQPEKRHQWRGGRHRDQTSLLAAGPPKSESRESCIKCYGQHKLAACEQFKALSVRQRWDLVRPSNMCICCLCGGHRAKDCAEQECGNCKKKHHSLLHYDKKPRHKPAITSEGHAPKSTSDMTRREPIPQSTTAAGIAASSVAFMTVSVKLKENKSPQQVTALLDSGSSGSYVTKDLAARLNLKGPTEVMETAVLGGGTMKANSQRVVVHICHEGSSSSTLIDALVIPQITTDLEVVDWNQEKHKWIHLSDINFASVNSGHVDMLIGLDAAELHASYEERRSKGGPIA